MSPEHLLQHFERISEASDAIPRLRRFILDLAVRGKLVGQDTNDEPAAELLKRIRTEKVRLVKEGKIKAQKPLEPTESDMAPPYELPANWEWVRFGETVNSHLGGGTPSKSNPTYWDGDIYWASVKDIGKEKYVDETIDHITEAGLADSSSNLIPPGNLIVVTRMGLGKVSINRVPIAINQDLRALSLTSLAVIDYYYIFFKTHSFEGTGLTVKGVKVEELLNIAFPLPPLAEQHRIVSKVDELMALCDQLEAAKTVREQSRDRLVAASLHCLNSPPDTAETDAPDLPARQTDTFRDHARFLFNHLPRLTARPEHIKQLRQTILNLAVRGKLVPQDSNDEPASSQLTLNDHARKKTAQKDRRADADLQQLLIPEEKWEVPASWAWRAVADIVLFIDYRGKTPSKVREGIRLITAKNVRKGFISLSPEEFLSESNYREWMTRGIPQEGDVLFTTEAPMGNAAVVQLKEQFALAQRVINFRPYGALDSNFLVLQLLAEPFQSILDKTATGLTAKGIKAAKLKRLPLAIPPLAEQHRIVARVDELMALCDQLEAQLTTTKANSRRLLEAVLHEALNPPLAAIEQMKLEANA